MFKAYYPVVKKYDDDTVVTIKTRRGDGELELVLVGVSLLSLLFVFLSVIQLFQGKYGSEGVVFLLLWFATTSFLLRDRFTLLKVDEGERRLIRKIADFLWTNHLYTLNHLGEIDYAVEATYQFEATNFIIGLNAVGTEYAKVVQEKEMALQSLFPRLRLIDKRIFNDRTEYVFTLEKDNRIYVN